MQYHKNQNKNFYYVFSYGSNLMFERIKRRVPSVEYFKTYTLRGHKMVFNKHSRRDGTSKANLVRVNDPNHKVYGVIHRMDMKLKPVLDRYEDLGNGYDLHSFHMELQSDSTRIYYYMATDPYWLCDHPPFDWYLEYVIQGMKENKFPIEYQRRYQNIVPIPDPDPERREEHKQVLQRFIKQ